MSKKCENSIDLLSKIKRDISQGSLFSQNWPKLLKSRDMTWPRKINEWSCFVKEIVNGESRVFKVNEKNLFASFPIKFSKNFPKNSTEKTPFTLDLLTKSKFLKRKNKKNLKVSYSYHLIMSSCIPFCDFIPKLTLFGVFSFEVLL